MKMLIVRTRGVSISSLSRDLNIPRKVLSSRVNGTSPFTMQLLRDVAHRLGTTVTEVVESAEESQAALAGSSKAVAS